MKTSEFIQHLTRMLAEEGDLEMGAIVPGKETVQHIHALSVGESDQEGYEGTRFLLINIVDDDFEEGFNSSEIN